MSEYVPMTQAGYEKIRAEIERLENEEMPKVREALAAARAEGDLRENAEYHGQRETLGMLTAKANQLKAKLALATIVDESKLPRDKVAFGATVRVMDLDLDEEESFTLVGAGEEDYDTGKYLVTSPIGQGLLGKKVGDKVEISVPKGKISFEILEISYSEA
ncbi:MAG: transcription elongation factor GreA [Pirellulaceae bacterium]|nr:transcription elongation factor GreA [Planctomycetales bacterium]MCA9822388.1 transcription elongation factor GreA [Dehalococcoidia bacterium]